jgi:hypothetical protein
LIGDLGQDHAKSDRLYPALSDFQALNLVMARDSARNVESSIPIRPAAKVLIRSRPLGIRALTYGAVAAHLAREWGHNWKSTRRRTFQAVLSFDVYYATLSRRQPEFSTFFWSTST